MNTIEQKLREAISRACEAEGWGTVRPADFQIQPTNAGFKGSHTVVCFPLARISKKNPQETAQALGNRLKESADGFVADIEVVKGFLNIVLSDRVWIDSLTTIISTKQFGFLPPSGQEIMVEYSSPNTNKPLHLGHLRNNFLGWSVAELYKAMGYTVHKVQIINDRGIHICKSMAAWKLFGNGETPASSGIKGDHLVGKYYVAFDKELKEQLKPVLADVANGVFTLFSEREATELRALNEKANEPSAQIETEKAIKEIAQNKTPIMGIAQDLLRRWEAKDAETLALWNTMNGWVYSGFDATYQRMGVDFEKLYYESNTYLLGKDEVMRGVGEGVFYKKDDGSVWVDLASDGLDQKLLLRSDGTSVYMTQDIGTAILRFHDFPRIGRQVYTVGNEQEYHFKVLFLILAKLGYAWAKECYHLSYGMVDLPTGKMKSREGTVVDADDLMQEMVSEADKQSKELGKIDDLTEAQRLDLAEMVGLGALKYFLLKVDPRKRMLFDPNESIQLQGHTGPFIQYTHARIQAIVRKAKELGIDGSAPLNIAALEPAERAVIGLINAFPARIAEAAREYSPAVVANYAFDLAREYNQFYQSIPIFNESDAAKLRFRIAFSSVVAETLRKSMGLLGIRVPDRM